MPIDSQEGLLLTDSQIKLRYAQSEGAPSTIETYLHSISEESVERFETDSQTDQNVGLELYNSSPKKYRKSPIDAALYSESENMYPEHWYVRGMPNNILRECPHPPDILKTRVCVELGYIPSSNTMGAEANILVEAPSIVLCNVDIEPPELAELPIISPKKSPVKKVEINETPQIIESPVLEIPERKQPEGREIIPEIKEDVPQDNLDKMLDRISDDLDYLLDRNILPEIQITPPSLTGSLRRTSKLPGSSIREEIKEEDEDLELCSEVVDIGKTAC